MWKDRAHGQGVWTDRAIGQTGDVERQGMWVERESGQTGSMELYTQLATVGRATERLQNNSSNQTEMDSRLNSTLPDVFVMKCYFWKFISTMGTIPRLRCHSDNVDNNDDVLAVSMSRIQNALL